jgi:hypothetical protein
MDLKAFKGLPHEFGGIDYTEGSEVEGGEFAVNIGKSGNEYIFDKNSSEGKKLSKDFKRLDMNGRLSEDDPLALEAFDQIAREEALKHAQRSVNEKGIDPFRNMYDQGGQAANGGVKYCNGGAKDMYFGGGVMALMPGGLIDTGTRDEGLMKDKISEVTNLGNGGVNKYATGGYNPRAMGNPIVGPNMMRLVDTMGGVDGILAMSNPNYSNPNNPNNPNNFGEDVGEVYPEGAFKGVNAPTPVSDVNNLTGSNAPQQSLATDPMTSMPTMETIPTMDSYQLPTQPTPEMPTADASYDVSSADISGGAGGGAGGGSPMGMITKGLGMASDVIQTLNPETKGGSDWLIAEKGNTRQRSIAPKYAWSTSGEMMGAAMNGMSQGAQMGSMAGPYGAAIGAAAGMVISPLMKGLADEKANKQLQLAFKGALMQKNAEERRDEQWDAIGRDVDSTELIDKDRYAGLNGLGSTGNKFAKQGGGLPKNKGIYGYYANGGGGGGGDTANDGNYNIDPSLEAELEQIRHERDVNTLWSGTTYQDLQGARSYPVYDEAGNEIPGVRNIGASTMSPGFDIRTNTYQPPVIKNVPQSRFGTSPQINNTMRRQELSAQPVRQSAPQQYALRAQDPCADNGLNQNANQGFNLYNEPRKYAQKGNYYNPESLQKNEFVGPPEMSITDPLNPNFVGPPEDLGATLTNNETGQSYNFRYGGGKSYTDKIKESDSDPYLKKFQGGGGKDKEEKGTVLEVNPENVTADGSQVLEYPYLLDEAVVEDKLDRTNPNAVKNWSRKNDPIAYAARKTGSDFINNATGGNFIPSNAKAYMQGILGRKEDFTEDDLTQSEIEVMSKMLNAGIGVTDKFVQEQYDTGKPEYNQKKFVSYDDWNRFGASSLHDATLRHLWDPASRWKTLLGSSDVTDRGEYWEVGPNAYDFDDYTDTPFSEMTLLNMAEHMYNKSPFRAKTPMNMHFRIPKQYKK